MAKPKDVSIHEWMAQRFALAQTYAEDGAFMSAARVLKDLSDDIKLHYFDSYRETFGQELEQK